jgi:hypothetical protein
LKFEIPLAERRPKACQILRLNFKDQILGLATNDER